MKILVVDLARYGNEQTVLQVYESGKSLQGAKRLPHYTELNRTLEEIALAATKVDYVCVDESGFGGAVVDELIRSFNLRDKLLLSHAGRAFNP